MYLLLISRYTLFFSNCSGVRVPQDMQVIGFDNVPDAEYCMPGLTTIDRMWMITRDMPWIC